MKTFDQLSDVISKNENLNNYIGQLEKIDINKKNEHNLTLLMLACQTGNIGAIKTLLSINNIDVNIDTGSPNYETALFFAAEFESANKEEIIFLLINHPNIPNIGKTSLNRALIFFATVGNINGVEICLKKGAEINTQYLRNTALSEAVDNGNIAVVKKLLKEKDIDINKVNYRYETPLINAIYHGYKEIIELLIQRDDCDYKIVSPLFGTALTAAIFFKQYDLAKKIITKIKNFHPDEHPLAMNWAIRNQNIELVQLLIHAEASINELGYKNYLKDVPTWLWQEIKLSESPAYYDRSNIIFELPILLALKTKNIEIIKLILNRNPDVEKKGAYNKSALNYIEENEIDQEEIKQLIKNYINNQRIKNTSIINQNSFFNSNLEDSNLNNKVAKLLGVTPRELRENIDKKIIEYLIKKIKIDEQLKEQELKDKSKLIGNFHGLIPLVVKIESLYKRVLQQSINKHTDPDDDNGFQKFKSDCKNLCNDIAKYEKSSLAQKTTEGLIILDGELIKRKTEVCNKGAELQKKYEELLLGNDQIDSFNMYNLCSPNCTVI